MRSAEEGKEKVLLTLVERINRHSAIRIIEGKTASCVSQAMSSLQREYGISFEENFSSTQGYYDHPYSSWERGANKQNNGIIRRLIPKGIDQVTVIEAIVIKIETWLNHYQRKILGYTSSFDVFYEYTCDQVA